MSFSTNSSNEYCMYLRKSRKDMEMEAQGSGDTLKRHRETLLSLAAKMQINVTYIYEEGVMSGDTIAERPQMQKLLDAVEQGAWKGVLVMEIPRLARGDTIDQGVVAQAFRYSGTLIVTPEKTYRPDDEYDEEYMEFGLFMSRREYKAINRRIQRGRLFSVQEGKWIANKAPYGWRRVKLEHEKGYTLEPDDTGASEVLQLMYYWASHPQPMPDGTTRRMGSAAITTKLNEMSIPSPSGKKWTAAVVREILINPVNAGWVRHNYRPAKKSVVDGEVRVSRPRSSQEDVSLYPGRHRGQISQEVFDDVKKFLLDNPSRPGPKQVAMKNPLSGLVICGSCGHAMVRRPYQNGRQETLLCPHTYCPTVASNLVVVEQGVLQAMREWLENFDLEYQSTKSDPAQGDSSGALRAALSALQKEHDQLAAQEARAYELVEQGIYSTEIFLQRSRAISERQKENQTQLEQISIELQHMEHREKARAAISPMIRTVLASYPLAQSPKEKNDLLKRVLQKVEYTKTNRNRRSGGGDMNIRIYPKLPY